MTATAEDRRHARAGETGVDLVLAIQGARTADAREDSAVAKARAHVRATLDLLKQAREADAEHDRELARAEALALQLNGLVHGIAQLELPLAEERAS